MKNKLFLLLGVFCFMPVSLLWGYDFANGKYLFFDNTNSQISSPHLRIGRSGNTTDGSKLAKAYSMKPIANTNLWYYQMETKWEKFEAFTVSNSAGYTNDKTIYQPYEEGGKIKPEGDYTITSQLVYQKYAVSGHILLRSTTKGELSKNCQYWNTEKSDISTKTDLNRTVTVKILLSTDGGTSYHEVHNYHGQISAQRYTFNDESYEKVNASTKDLTAESSYVTSALSAVVTFTESNTKEGMLFKGWSKTNTQIESSNTVWDFLCTGNNTVYAYFEYQSGPLGAEVWTEWKNDIFPSAQFILANPTDRIAVATVEITDAAKTYGFKYSKSDGNWFGNKGTIDVNTDFSTWWSFTNLYGKTDQDDWWCTIKPVSPGTMTIHLNLDNDRVYISMPYDLKISSVGYASFYGENNLTIPDGLIVQYITEASEEDITWVELNRIIPKHTGVILSGEEGVYTAYTTTDKGPTTEGNILLGTEESTNIVANGKPHYVLSNGKFGVGMYFPNFDTVDDETGIGDFTNGAHKAYLELNPTSHTPQRILFNPRMQPTQLGKTETSVKNKKMFINGQLYIVRNATMYDARGQQIK